MRSAIKVLLFDIDGVIVDPIAYRIGITKMLEHFCHKLGLANIDQLLPQEDEIAYMEACGIHDVWDISNIIFASILSAVYSSFKLRGQFIELGNMSFVQKMHSIKTASPQVNKPDYIALVDKLKVQPSSLHPPDTALQLFTAQIKSISELSEVQCSGWIELLQNFLIGTRSVYESYGTRFFQNIILGSHQFEKTYGLVAEYTGESLLSIADKVLISTSTVNKMRELNARHDYRLAIYTARPSLPPSSVLPIAGYSPEAEMALELADAKDFPLIGMGMIEWLAKQYNERSEDLTKPNTTQAFAALLSALARTNDVKVLKEAYILAKLKRNPDETILKQIKSTDITIYLFEDTISGIIPILSMAKSLASNGYSISVRPFGISSNENKRIALNEFCEKLFSNINEAFDFALRAD
jgi:hypothetical protein